MYNDIFKALKSLNNFTQKMSKRYKSTDISKLNDLVSNFSYQNNKLFKDPTKMHGLSNARFPILNGSLNDELKNNSRLSQGFISSNTLSPLNILNQKNKILLDNLNKINTSNNYNLNNIVPNIEQLNNISDLFNKNSAVDKISRNINFGNKLFRYYSQTNFVSNNLANILQKINRYNTNEEYFKIVEDKYPEFNQYIDNISKCNWVVLHSEYSIDTNELHYRNQLQTDELDKLIYNSLIKNNYEKLKIEFNHLIDNMRNVHSSMMNGYVDKISQLYSLFFAVNSSCTLFIPLLFTLLESLLWECGITEEFNSNKNIINYWVVNNARIDKEQKVNNDKYNHELFSLFIFNTYDISARMYESFGYTGNPNPETVPLTRNSTLHGKIDPSRFTKEDFIKLVVLCSSVSDLLYN